MMGVLLPCLVALLALFFAWFLRRQFELYIWKEPPGPMGLPFVGYLPFLRPENIHVQIAEMNRKYGKLCRMRIGLWKTIVVSDFDTAKDLLCQQGNYSRPSEIFSSFLPGGGGFAFSNGKQWFEERRFCMQALKTLGAGKASWGDDIMENVAEFINYASSAIGKSVDIFNPLSICVVKDMIILLMGASDLQSLQPSLLADVVAIDSVMKKHLLELWVFFGFPQLRQVFIKLNLFGYTEKFAQLNRIFDLVREKIRKRLYTDEYDSTDFIKLYIENVKNEEAARKELEPLVDRCLGNLLSLGGGGATTIAGARWLLCFMATYPEIQIKVQAEIDEVVEKEGAISWENQAKFPYTFACISEMFRWVTVIPLYAPRRYPLQRLPHIKRNNYYYQWMGGSSRSKVLG